MANEKHDPWALLREARAHVFNWSDYTFAQDRLLADRIDAALAAHDAVSPHEECDESKAIWRAYVNRELSEDEAKANLAALEAK